MLLPGTDFLPGTEFPPGITEQDFAHVPLKRREDAFGEAWVAHLEGKTVEQVRTRLDTYCKAEYRYERDNITNHEAGQGTG